MKIVITSGSGFLGERVARQLLKRGHVDDSLGFPRDEGGFDRIINDYVRDEGLKL
jgi:nucleoside-diphosphate-sugar epimerase